MGAVHLHSTPLGIATQIYTRPLINTLLGSPDAVSAMIEMSTRKQHVSVLGGGTGGPG